MALPILFIADHRIEIDILYAPENIFLNIRILLPKLPDQFLDLRALGALLGSATGCAVLRKAAGALDKVQIVVIHPVDDVLLSDEIKRTN